MSLAVVSPRSRADRMIGLAAGIVAIVIWAGWIVWTGRQIAAADGPGFAAFDIALMRFGPPALLLAPFWLRPLLRREGSPLDGIANSFKPAETPWPLLLMMLGWGAPFVLLASEGMMIAEAPLMAAMIPGAAPLYAALLGALLFGVRPKGGALLGLALIGAAAITSLIATPVEQIGGAAWFAAAAIGWAGYIVAFPRARLSPLRAVGLLSAWSTVMLLAAAPFSTSHLGDIPLNAVLTELFLQGVVSGALSIVAYTVALDLAPPIFAACLPAFVPVLAALFSAVFVGAAPSLGQAIGLVVASGGLVVLGLAALRQNARQAPASG